MMAAPFVPRAAFPALDSLPRSYYLGHHAAGLAKMRTLLSQIDLIIECRDYRIPLTSRNPQFEDVLSQKERVIVYTKKDLVDGGSKREDHEVDETIQTPRRRGREADGVLLRRGKNDFDLSTTQHLCASQTFDPNAISAASSP